jgi:uncharacterized membrane protein YhaH (DUF805 family)
MDTLPTHKRAKETHVEATNNPYQTPEGQLTTDGQGYGEINFFSPSSRIGRLRYLSHSFIFMVASYLVLAAGLGLAIGVSGIFWVIVGVAYIAMIVVSVIMLIQRLHDLNKTGWMSLIMFIPLVNLFFVFYVLLAPGTPGTNNFGLQPPPNKTWNWILGLAMPVIAVLGIVAAIALPAYMGYSEGMSTDYSDYQYDDDAQYEDAAGQYGDDTGDAEATDYSDYSDEE